MEIEDTIFWFYVAKDNILPKNILINKYTENGTINMLEFLVDNIFVFFGERFS